MGVCKPFCGNHSACLAAHRRSKCEALLASHGRKCEALLASHGRKCEALLASHGRKCLSRCAPQKQVFPSAPLVSLRTAEASKNANLNLHWHIQHVHAYTSQSFFHFPKGNTASLTAWTTPVSNQLRSPRLRASVSEMIQKCAFALGIPPNI